LPAEPSRIPDRFSIGVPPAATPPACHLSTRSVEQQAKPIVLPFAQGGRLAVDRLGHANTPVLAV
jgi:hypothetical protein